MMKSIVRSAVLFVAIVIEGKAVAQSSSPVVEWKVSDGGNGHFYQLQGVGPINWLAAKTLCEGNGGHLATITSVGEQTFVHQLIVSVPGFGESPTRLWGPWLGGFQDHSLTSYSEPSGGWSWVTGETWSLTFWESSSPNNLCEETNATEDFLIAAGDHGRDNSHWNDMSFSGCDNDPIVSLVIEWDSEPLAQFSSPVEWKVSDGGNGHWYQVIDRPYQTYSWTTTRNQAVAMGGDLVSCGQFNEWAFVKTLVQTLPSPQLLSGGFRPPNASLSILNGWQWLDGSPWVYSAWTTGTPNNNPGESLVLAMALGNNQAASDGWDDWRVVDYSNGYIVEWVADCNGDGIVDYGQIQSCDLLDVNGNNIPDCCENESPCGPNLIVNPSYEAGLPLAACSSESVIAGQSVGGGWLVSQGVVDRVRADGSCNSAGVAKYGKYFVDLCGTPASSGAIKQIIPTKPGHHYQLSFWLSGDCSIAPASKSVIVKIGDYISSQFEQACAGSGVQTWSFKQFEFVARNSNELLEFAANNGITTAGPLLDGIFLIDITSGCIGDLNDDGTVDGADLGLVLLNYGDCSP